MGKWSQNSDGKLLPTWNSISSVSVKNRKEETFSNMKVVKKVFHVSFLRELKVIYHQNRGYKLERDSGVNSYGTI